MITNLLILLVVLAFTIGAGWLTVKAVRAKRLWVKIVGGLLAGALTLLLGALTFAGAKGLMIVYYPGVAPAPTLTVVGTPEQIARGEYIVGISCLGCHGSFPNGLEGAPEYPLVGGVNLAEAEGFGFVGRLATENLTPGGKLANYTDGEIFRALRHGVDKNGQVLGFMSLISVGELSNEDLEALIAFLRAQPAATTDSPTGDKIGFIGLVFWGAGMFPAPQDRPDVISAPPSGPTAEYGKYVATIGDCRGCHGSDMTGTPASPAGPAVPNPRPLVGQLTLEEFIKMFRSGVRPDGTAFPAAMPWQSAAAMTDGDLAGLYAYLTTAP
ncbi:MAG TPA: c-type cytochrome [Anaerolineales bacterium]|nr:c-type cytochrome [Anaerolineales bacterium]